MRMDRSTIVVDGTNKYQVIATCVVKGTLPDISIFLLDINTADDPKDDTMARVVAVADIDIYKTDRDTAVASGDALFRSPSVTLQFDNLDTANAGQKELKARINTLVGEIDAFLTEFETTAAGEIVTYPTVDPSVKTQRIDDYTATLAPITAAEEARDTEQAACTLLETNLSTVEERLSEAQADLAALIPIQSGLSNSTTTLVSVQATLGGDRTSIRTFNSASSASTSEKADIETELVSMDAQLVLFAAENTSLSSLNTGAVTTLVGTLQTRVASLSSQRTALQTDLNKCNRDVSELQAAVDSARATRDAALASVLAVCPDFTPSS